MPFPERANSLYVKSFFAGSIPAAMEQARRELGADALLLNSRQAPPEARHLGDYEVVFGAWPETVKPAAPAAPAPLQRANELPHRVDEIRDMISRFRPVGPPLATEEPGVARVFIGAGVDSEVALSIERGVHRRITKGAVLEIARPHAADGSKPPSATIDELDSRFEVKPEIGRITALVGPPGSGKTTTLAKLAIKQCLKLGRAVRLISADNVRIGGAEQLRTYAAILGVPFQSVESTLALAQAVDSAPSNVWLLIDTPGFSAALQQELGDDLAGFLSRRQDIDTHLVLTASMNPDDLRSTTDRFARFSPGKLLFTHLDETTSAAAVFSEAARTKKPVSFLCHGQAVPEDMVAASKDLIIDSLVRELPDSLQAVA
jgi:flagellar biosynthesis protein FlhF